ncbi:hypothetical protein D3C85_844040 [compost metagenome]
MRAGEQSVIQPISTPLNVLVVDDHPANRLLMCQQLEFLGRRDSLEMRTNSMKINCKGFPLLRGQRF